MIFPKTCPACNHPALAHDERKLYCTNCEVYQKPLNFVQRPLAWAEKRSWKIRLLIYIWFVVMFKDNLRDSSFALSRISNPFSAFDLGIHELGHVLFSPFGDFMHILGGSLFQCLFPLLWLIAFVQKKWHFAACLCWCWLGLNLFDVATYAADARARTLPLTAGFGAIGLDSSNAESTYDRAHDWFQILSRTHHLNSDLVIAHNLRVAATICFIIGLSSAGVLLLRMIQFWVMRLGKKQTTKS